MKALHLARNLMLDRALIGDVKRLRARIEFSRHGRAERFSLIQYYAQGNVSC